MKKRHYIKVGDRYFKKIDGICLCTTIYKSDAHSSEIKMAVLDYITALKKEFPDYKFTLITYNEN